MKVPFFLVLALALLLGLGIWSSYAIAGSAQELTKYLNELETTLEEGDWRNSDSHMQPLLAKWSKTQQRWTLLLDHQEIDNIDLALARLHRFVQTRDLSAALAELAALQHLVRHIPELSKFTLQNIF